MSSESFLCQHWQAILGYGLALLLTFKLVRILFPGRRRAPSRPAFPMPKDTKAKRATGKVIECVNPATGEKLGEVNSFTPDEVVAAYKAAKIAAADWSKSSFAERRALLMDILDWVVANQPTIIKWSTEETGKTMTEASLGEVMMTCEKLRWLVAHGEDALLPEDRPVPSILMTKKARVEYYPCGVIGAIVPWNYPVHNVLGAASAALFAGNGFICKVSEISSFYAADLERVMRTIIAKRGYNPELVTLVTGYGDAGAALVRSGVEKVLFIGSPATGKRVMNAASDSLTPVILELGGKDPFIVFDDANLNHVLDIALRGAFINQGQNCISAERFYVQAGVYDKFVKLVQSRLSELRAGAHSASNRCDFGSMTMGLQVNIVKDLIKDAVSKGAKVISGGNPKRWEGPNNKDGKGAKAKNEEKCLFHEPTILADVTHQMNIANEEAFGPVMTIIKFSTEEEVVRLANCTKYGLGCSIFSNYTRAERVGSQMDCGQVSINDFAQVPLIQSLPFGGCKDSGFGHFNGKEGLRGFSRVRSVVTDRFRFPMEAPKFLQYPISPAAYQIVQEGVKMVYGPGWISSAVALVRMLKLIISNKPEVKAKDE